MSYQIIYQIGIEKCLAGVVMHINKHLFEDFRYQGKLQLQAARSYDHILRFPWLFIELV